MCRRTTSDPLVRRFLDEYSLHLLSLPRENADIGDLYVHDGRRAAAPGSVTHMLEPALGIPEVRRDEALADLSGSYSDDVSAKVGVRLLDGFVAALSGGAVTTLGAAFDASGATAVKFRFVRATRDSVDPLALGRELVKSRIREDHPLFAEDHRFYLVTAVVRTDSLSVSVDTRGRSGGELDLGLFRAATVEGAVSVEKTGEWEIEFSGPKRLAFGVELFELAIDPDSRKIAFRIPEDPMRLRAATPRLAPAMVGGEEGDVFLPG